MYDPNSRTDRSKLAAELQALFAKSGFKKLETRGEEVYEYPYGDVSLLVYSSIVDGAVRGDGEDAIRVAAIYRRKDGQVRGLFKDTRVNRTGEIEKIVHRTHERMRGAYKSVRSRIAEGKICPCCRAPLFVAKSGKEVCAETCWTTKKGN